MLLPLNAGNDELPKPTAQSDPSSSSAAMTFNHLQDECGRDVDGAFSLSSARHEILRLGASVGSLCGALSTHAPLDGRSGDDDGDFWDVESPERDAVASCMGRVLSSLVVLSVVCGLDLQTCVLKKMGLNERKYPADLVRARGAGKYTAYSDTTGITTDAGQDTSADVVPDDLARATRTIEGATRHVRAFASARDWGRYHTPRSLTLALAGELGELAELLQWRGDNDDDENESSLTTKESDKLGQEIADVTIYLLRLADVCRVTNLGELALRTTTTPTTA